MDILEAYRLVVDAANRGANVNPVVPLLNEALNATGAERDALLEQVASEVAKAQAAKFWADVYTWAAAATAVALALLFVAYRRKVVGFLFLKIHGKRRVMKGAGRKKTLLFDEEVAAIVAAVAVVAAAFAVASQFKPVEPFTALGLLGPGGKIGNYPTEVDRGSTVTLYLYVYNHMGHPVWFRVVARYVQSPNVTASPTGFYVKEFFLGDNQSIVLPVTFVVNSTGVFKAELWMYQPDGSLIYTNRTVYLWIKAR
ncbi:MAG: DUF1616 domain-containing protein [Thermoproteus sp.]